MIWIIISIIYNSAICICTVTSPAVIGKQMLFTQLIFIKFLLSALATSSFSLQSVLLILSRISCVNFWLINFLNFDN